MMAGHIYFTSQQFTPGFYDSNQTSNVSSPAEKRRTVVSFTSLSLLTSTNKATETTFQNAFGTFQVFILSMLVMQLSRRHAPDSTFIIGSMFYVRFSFRNNSNTSYGPKGTAVFQATLNRLFDPQTDAINPSIFAPMTLDRYNQFVLIPYIACRLIAEDRKCNMEDAFKVMIASGDYGDGLQAIDDKDERFDDFLMSIVRKDSNVKVGFIISLL